MSILTSELKGSLGQAYIEKIAQLSFLDPSFHEPACVEDDRMMSALCGAPAFSPMARRRNRVALRFKHRKQRKQWLDA